MPVTFTQGSYTEEPVQTRFGWQLMLLDDLRGKHAAAFDDVK